MRNYSDPTANAAIGAVEKEFKAKEKYAKRLKELRRNGLISEKTLAKARADFPGIFSVLYVKIFEE